MNLKYRISQFMYGRYLSYGIDLLTKILAIICIALSVLNLFIGSLFIYLFQTLLLFYMLFRLFSKNIYKRQEENRKVANSFAKIKSASVLNKKKYNDRNTHIYKKCPHCSVMLRLPKKSGEHNVNCPRCKNDFKVKVR